MKPKSAKRKGREAAKEVRVIMLKVAAEYFDDVLHPDEIIVKPGGLSGEDLYLSPKARDLYPWAVEVKNQEKLNIWDAIRQCEGYGRGDREPILVFRRNRDKLRAVIDFESLCHLFIEAEKYREG